MTKLYVYIVIAGLASFLMSCEEYPSINGAHGRREVTLETDTQFLKEQRNSNERTASGTVALNKVSVWLKRDQWAGGEFRIVVIEKESGKIIARSVFGAVVSLKSDDDPNSFTRINFNSGNVAVKAGVMHKINLEFTRPYEDVGRVFSAASNSDTYEDGCGPTCNYDLAFQTYNRRSDGTVYTDQGQSLKEKLVTVNKLTTIGQEFVPRDFP